jgi:hypothetical protein
MQEYFSNRCDEYPPLAVNNGTVCRAHATLYPLHVDPDVFDVALGDAMRHIGM